MMYSNKGFAQVLFFDGDETCKVSYTDRKDMYQKQQSILFARL